MRGARKIAFTLQGALCARTLKLRRCFWPLVGHRHRPPAFAASRLRPASQCLAKAARRSPKGEDGQSAMRYVYLLESISHPDDAVPKVRFGKSTR